jgi:N-acetyltransferase 10
MASTIHGYEGTGRSLSLKLLSSLRQQSSFQGESFQSKQSSGVRLLKEVKLEQAIRYADNDPIEEWLNKLLILDATNNENMLDTYPNPEELELYYVNRDTLFSFHKGSEAFLKKLMTLFVSSHYKNSPNDLQLLSDAPAHSIFVLVRNMESQTTEGPRTIPDIYCAIQVCEEGGINKSVILNNNRRGFKPAGDLIPWTISEHYQDNEFPHLQGIRVVRIATHPDCQKMGYGSRALQILSEFFEGKIINLGEKTESTMKGVKKPLQGAIDGSLLTEDLKPRKKLPPLLSKLSDIKPPMVHYLGTAFGLTKELFSFWKKNEFIPLYLKLTENDITGEHSTIMVKPLKDEDVTVDLNNFETSELEDAGRKGKWLTPFSNDFKKRLISLFGSEFRNLSIKLAISLIEPQVTSTTSGDEDANDATLKEDLQKIEVDLFLSKYDFRRLEMYTKNLVKYQMIIDLVPLLARFYFLKRFKSVRLAYTQAAILLGYGLQFKSFDNIAEELAIQTHQILAMFNKMIKKFTNAIKGIYESEIKKEDNKESKVIIY